MAIERLLSFKAETTVQLAVALSALVPQTDRSAEFARAKKAYNLRSRIAHGYDFRRDDAMFYELEWLASVFRTLMKVALRVEGVGDLKDRLIDHVLSGAHDRIS